MKKNDWDDKLYGEIVELSLPLKALYVWELLEKDRKHQREKLLKRLSVKKISEIILATCEKELNETLGFMLTNDEALLFAKAIHSLVKEKLEGKG